MRAPNAAPNGGHDPAALAGAVKAIARACGARAVRIAGAAADDDARERMRTAFRRGDFATWSYDDRYAAAASDPRTILPGAKSVVCIAMPYATPRTMAYARNRTMKAAKRMA